MTDKSKNKWREFKDANEMDDANLFDENVFSDDRAASENLNEDDEKDSQSEPDAKSPKQKNLSHSAYEELEEQLTLAEQKAHENWEKATRALAELDNVRRRAERDVSNAHRYGVEKLLTALIPVADSLEQALQIAEKGSDMSEGLTLTLKLFTDILTKYGVEQLDPVGEPFNPQLHEAMSMQASPDHAANTILAVFQKGYKLHDRIIRPARVVVAKG